MAQSSTKRIAICSHGFLGEPGMLREVEATLTESPFDQVYDRVSNLSYYSSKHGINFTRPYDLKTPIYKKNITQTLAHRLFKQISSIVKEFEEEVDVDIFAHSMGGLVTRSMIKYLAEEKKTDFWIQNGRVRNIFLLGSPNHGTRLAQRAINIPVDIMLTGLNILLELPEGVTSEDWHILESQFMQMVPNSSFLKQLNQSYRKMENAINWVTVRGLKYIGQLGWLPMVWQPFLFRKIWIDHHFPFLHIGIIPNDGLVDANRVPLKFATNLTVSSATHMSLLYWKSKKAGRQVLKLLKPIILEEP
ncbi:MAG: alpha/beta hydrolase [Candidatus Heimdallarchaeota archaeon]|nr:MAG: alpha/beta hydrolase [Candidatus Heimdallarchaeota archaeon]